MENDLRLIKQIKKNASESAASALVSKYYKEMYAFHYKQTLDEELSLDLTQELFIAVLQTIYAYDVKKASFRTWLYRIASNRIVDYFRSRHYRYAQFTQPLEDIQQEFEDEYNLEIALVHKEQFERVNSLVNQLDAHSQQVIRLKLFGEYTLKEIAAIEAIPISTVKTRYYAALKWIRKEMEVEKLEERSI
ncbi:sigma-70 family RNA polymerase sigma factor [Sporosarcina sp. ACRSL]|uniref:RNA polymerase sigma factor n=1 Tax=Sporosarcina sp. ACRSL TaxID=2918215 RepID=UPI001EF49DEC|nr:sigma-70 family RNA polymerase sigma factor [Sporosarcina sp. ACRSL]MCG7344602.1 sigma-70 family RNA polymerase sigma factor [Sporosarcina sp. ACRSL]